MITSRGVTLRLLFPPSLGELKATAKAERLADSLARTIGTRVAIKVARTYGDLEYRVLHGLVELAWAPPSICAKAEPNALAILKAVRGGRASYRSALVGRVSDTPRVERLDGKRAAWIDPLSAAGHLLPVAYLRSRGVDPASTLREQWFVGSYRAALLAVLTGDADITAIYSSTDDPAPVRATMHAHVGSKERELVPFAFTEETPSDGLILGGKIAAADADRLISVLCPAPDPERGRSLLLETLDADALVPAVRGDYANLRS